MAFFIIAIMCIIIVSYLIIIPRQKKILNYKTWHPPKEEIIKSNDNNWSSEKIQKTSKSEDRLFKEKCPLIKRRLMTKNEQELYKLIKEHIPEVLIFSQVQLSQITFYPYNNLQEAKYWNNRINRMSVDFVITNSLFEIITVIELDDPTHQQHNRIKQDQKKDKVLQDARIKIIRIPINNKPTGNELREMIITELLK